MCLWVRRKPSLETALDPRFGSATITAPTSGAYADPASPPTNLVNPPSPLPAVSQSQSKAQASSQPSPQPPMTAISHYSHHSPTNAPSLHHQASTSSKPTSSIPSKSPPHSPIPSPSRPLSSSTQFSTYHSSTSPSPQPSPKWSKTSIHGQGRASPSQPSPSIGSPQSHSRAPPQTSHPSSRATSPAPLPVHQAYIPSDQLSIGSKLSPGLTTSAGTTPTTGGPRTGNSVASSHPVSPVSGTNGWGRESNPSPSGVTFESSRAAVPRQNASGTGGRGAQGTQQTIPPWEKEGIPRMMTVDEAPRSRQGQQQQTLPLQQKAQGQAGRARNRLSRIQLPSIKLGTGGPRRRARRGEGEKEWEKERSPDSEVEQWPGSM